MRSDWAHRVKEVEEAASRSDERARLAEEPVRIMTIQLDGRSTTNRCFVLCK